MQSVKLLVRNVGNVNGELGIISEGQLNEYIDYQFTSQGYKLFESHFLSNVKDMQGNVQGFQFAFVFVKDALTPSVVPSQDIPTPKIVIENVEKVKARVKQEA